ncbi:unnamed protein product [Adineta steineri]|uniref:Uncharacterized protein n=1 Tax=Adineta steineri TaxID=433720 RepID=A0A819EWV2_9BILA|nr:unnamed protein product [Adineta steineri]
MSNHITVIEEDENQIISSLLPINQRATRSQLLTKIYYPDTLYPDYYSFFADRRDTTSPRVNASLYMDQNEQYPTTTTMDTTGSPISMPSMPKHPTTENEIIDRQNKYAAPMIDRERGESESEKHRFDVKRFIPTALRPQDKSQAPVVLLDPRFYSLKKTAMTIMCLLIIIMSNSVQLKHVLKPSSGSANSFYGTQVTLGIVSILMCASIGIIQLYLFLFTRLEQVILSSSALENLTRYERILLLTPAALLILLFLFDMIFLIIMFQF